MKEITFQEFNYAENGNYYDIQFPPEKTEISKSIQNIVNKNMRQCLELIEMNDIISSIDKSEIFNPLLNCDYYHKPYFPQLSLSVDGLIQSKLFLPSKQGYLCVLYIKSRSNWKKTKKTREIMLKAYLLSLQYPSIEISNFVLFIMDENKFVMNPLHMDKDKLDTVLEKVNRLKRDNYEQTETPFIPSSSKLEIKTSFHKMNEMVKNNEITLLPYCSQEDRIWCMGNGIDSFTHVNFVSFIQSKKSKYIDMIKNVIEVNSPNYEKWKLIRPELYNTQDWKLFESKYNEEKVIYFDLEFISGKNIYLCGFYSNSYDFIWEDDDERMFHCMISYFEKYKDYCFVYYDADKNQICSKFKKFNTEIPNGFFDNFIDLSVFTKKYCGFKGIFNFSMKSLEKVFEQQGLITNTYDNGQCVNGLQSCDIYEEYFETKDESLKQSLIEYNKLDCINQKIVIEQLFDTE